MESEPDQVDDALLLLLPPPPLPPPLLPPLLLLPLESCACHYNYLLPASFHAVVLAALTFFALRPHKGWLRRQQQAALLEEGSSGKAEDMHSTGGSSVQSDQCDWRGTDGPSRPSASPPSTLPAGSGSGPVLDTLLVTSHPSGVQSEVLDTLLPYSCAPSNTPDPHVSSLPAPQLQLKTPPDSAAFADWPNPSLQPGPPLPLPITEPSVAAVPSTVRAAAAAGAARCTAQALTTLGAISRTSRCGTAARHCLLVCGCG